MKKLICLLIMSSLSMAVFAANDTDNVVDAYFKATKMKEQTEVAMLAGLKAGMGMQDLSNMPAEQKAKMEAMMKKIEKLMLEEMGWDKMKADYKKMVLSIYSVEELKEITTMLNTPIGKKMVENDLKLIPKATALGQQKAQALMPKIMQISMEAMQP